MKILNGRQPPHGAERSKAIIHELEVSQRGTEAEVLVGFFMWLAQQELPPNGSAPMRKLWRPSKLPPRSLQPQQIRQICRDLQMMHEEWQALALGESITLFWEMAVRQRRARRSA